MKYLLLLLVLTACSKAETAKTPTPEPLSQTVSEDAPEIPGNHEDPDETILMSTKDIDIYLLPYNKYREQYENFFHEQLRLNGSNIDGHIWVNRWQLDELEGEYGYSIIVDRITPSYKTLLKIQIIEHGKTNYYPVLD